MEAISKFSHYFLGTRHIRTRVHGSDGSLLRRFRLTVRLRQSFIGFGPSYERFLEWIGQFTRVPEVQLPKDEGA